MDYIEKRFTLDIFDYKHSIKGITYGKTWNGWQCPYFTKVNALKLVKLFNGVCGEDDNPLSYNKEKNMFIYDNGEEHEHDEYNPILIDNKEYYPIGSHNWCWFIKR